METKSHNIVVEMPDGKCLEICYYCSDDKIPESKKSSETELFIQFDDCLHSSRIKKSVLRQRYMLEHIVHKKVIMMKEHLCS